MPLVRFTANIQRHVTCPDLDVTGATVRAALDAYFAGNPTARGYVLDERGCLRQHMNIFVGGRLIADRNQLSDDVSPDDTIDVMQALSGG